MQQFVDRTRFSSVYFDFVDRIDQLERKSKATVEQMTFVQTSMILHTLELLPSREQLARYSTKVLDYVHRTRSTDGIDYLATMNRARQNKASLDELRTLTDYFVEVCLHQKNLHSIDQILSLSSSFNYSNELLLRTLLRRIDDLIDGRTSSSVNCLIRVDVRLCVDSSRRSSRRIEDLLATDFSSLSERPNELVLFSSDD